MAGSITDMACGMGLVTNLYYSGEVDVLGFPAILVDAYSVVFSFCDNL